MQDAYDKFIWRETSPGTWTRDADEAEMFYYYLRRANEGSGRMYFAMTGHLSLCVDKPDECTYEAAEARIDDALRHGWLQLRFDCPTVASQTIYDEQTAMAKKEYRVFSKENTTESWLRLTFRSINNGMTGKEWCNSDPPAPNLPTLFLITPPGESTDGIVRRDLVFRAPHDIIDGVGTIHLMNTVISNAARAFSNGTGPAIEFGSEVKNLSPPLRVAAGISPYLSSSQNETLAAISIQHKMLRTGVEVASIPFKPGARVPGRHQRESIILSKEQTDALLVACRKFGATVTHAFHAAASLTVGSRQERRSQPRKVRYINYILANERPSCQGEYGTAKHAATVYHSVPHKTLYVDLTVPSTDSAIESVTTEPEFLNIMTYMRDFYTSVRKSKEDIHYAPLSWAKARPQWSPSLDGTFPPVPEPNLSPSVSISSMGLIDSLLKPDHEGFRVFSPWVTGEELGTGLGLFLGTFRGQLELSCAYNEAWHERSEVRLFIQDCWLTVRDSLKIPA